MAGIILSSSSRGKKGNPWEPGSFLGGCHGWRPRREKKNCLGEKGEKTRWEKRWHEKSNGRALAFFASLQVCGDSKLSQVP